MTKILLVLISLLMLGCEQEIVYIEKEVLYYRIQFDTGFGDDVDDIFVIQGEYIDHENLEKAEKQATRTGYRFMNWQVSNKNIFGNYRPTSDMTIYATWEKNDSTYSPYGRKDFEGYWWQIYVTNTDPLWYCSCTSPETCNYTIPENATGSNSHIPCNNGGYLELESGLSFLPIEHTDGKTWKGYYHMDVKDGFIKYNAELRLNEKGETVYPITYIKYDPIPYDVSFTGKKMSLYLTYESGEIEKIVCTEFEQHPSSDIYSFYFPGDSQRGDIYAVRMGEIKDIK